MWDLSLYFLQQQNIKQKPPKRLNEEIPIEVKNELPIEEENTTTTKIDDLEPSVETEQVQEEKEVDIVDISSNLTEVKQLPEKENITYTVSSI